MRRTKGQSAVYKCRPGYAVGGLGFSRDSFPYNYRIDSRSINSSINSINGG